MGGQLITLRMNWPQSLVTLREHILPRERPLTLAQMAFLGAVVGALAGLAIAALHRLIEFARLSLSSLQFVLHDTLGDNGPALVITAMGGLLLGLLYQLFKPRHRHGGFVHIIERLTYHQGQFPGRNLWLQFIGTALATATH